MVVGQVQDGGHWGFRGVVFKDTVHLIELEGFGVGADCEVLPVGGEDGGSDGLGVGYFVELHDVFEGIVEHFGLVWSFIYRVVGNV